MISELAHAILAEVDAEAEAWSAHIQPDGTYVVTDRRRFTALDLDFNQPLEVLYHAEVVPTLELAENYMALRSIQHAIDKLALCQAS